MHSNLPLLAALAMSSLVSAAWQGAVLAVLMKVTLRLLPPVSAAVRSFLWLVVFTLAVLLHFTPAAAGDSVATPAAVNTLRIDLRWSLLLAAVWLGLSLVRGWQLAVSALHLRRIARNSTLVLLPTCRATLPRRAVLCTSDEVDRPSVVGFFAPRILLPPDLLQTLSSDELEQVLLHETEHLRRNDDWTNLLQKLALVLFPLNPVLLYVERQLCLERELACDDRVLAATAAPKAYARCLTSLAEHTVLRRSLALALGAWQRQSELGRRVLRILELPPQTLSRTKASLLGGILCAGLVGASLSLAHAPRLISFLPSPLPALAACSNSTSSVAQTSAWSCAAPVTEPHASFHYASSNPRQSGVHEVLAKASGNTSPTAQMTGVRRRQPRVQAHPRLFRTVAAQVAEAPATLHLTLTLARTQAVPTAEQDSTFHSHLQPAYTRVVTYAAVPFGDGWLIIQL